MERVLALIVLFLLVFPVSALSSQEAGKTGILKITSPAFENNKSIPKKYTCDGANVNPPLKIQDIPPGAKSLVFVLDDKDAPRGTYVHWIS